MENSLTVRWEGDPGGGQSCRLVIRDWLTNMDMYTVHKYLRSGGMECVDC